MMMQKFMEDIKFDPPKKVYSAKNIRPNFFGKIFSAKDFLGQKYFFAQK